MDWISQLNDAMSYVEENLTKEITLTGAARLQPGVSKRPRPAAQRRAGPGRGAAVLPTHHLYSVH